jgi:hypothetical protein
MNTPPIQHPGVGQQPYQPEQEAIKLRQRLNDLFRLGAATPETLQQAFMQVWQETERRRQSCLSEADDHLRKYQALLAQSGAFSAIGSIAYAVINGYVQLEEKRLQEKIERDKERLGAPPPPPVVHTPPQHPRPPVTTPPAPPVPTPPPRPPVAAAPPPPAPPPAAPVAVQPRFPPVVQPPFPPVASPPPAVQPPFPPMNGVPAQALPKTSPEPKAKVKPPGGKRKKA